MDWTVFVIVLGMTLGVVGWAAAMWALMEWLEGWMPFAVAVAISCGLTLGVPVALIAGVAA